MKRLFNILCILLIFLNGCAKKEPSTAIADSVKSDIIVVEKQLDDVKDNLPKECQNTTVKANLSTIQANIKTITAKVDNIDLSCKTEKEVYKQQISKLHIIICSLIAFCMLLIFVLVKRKSIL